MSRQPTRYLFVHAHPDDETLATGAMLLGLAARGDRTYVLTATRGEQGEVVPSSHQDLEGTAELAQVRQRELNEALAALGVTGHAWLGHPPARVPGAAERRYTDSGMRWVTPTVAGPGDHAGADSLTAAPLAEVSADIAAYAVAIDADVLVSYAADGGYGHPDHIRCHDATVAAAQTLQLPFAHLVTEPAAGVEWVGTDDLETLRRAHRAHATQFTLTGDTVVHVGGQHDEMVTAVGLSHSDHGHAIPQPHRNNG